MAERIERWELNPAASGITVADGQGAKWADIWDFQVPYHVEIVLNPADIVSFYLVGDDASEMPNITQIRVVKRDTTNEESTPILSDINYKTVKEFADKKKLAHLTMGSQIVVGTDEHIVVQINGADAATTGDTDASASHFKLVTTRRRKGL